MNRSLTKRCDTKLRRFPRRANQEEAQPWQEKQLPARAWRRQANVLRVRTTRRSGAPLTTEFWAMLLLIVAVLIAAAISDSLNDIRGWTLATIIGAAYILSRGLAKGGTDHAPFVGRGRRRT